MRAAREAGGAGKIVEALRTHDWQGKTRVVRINQVTSEFAFDDLREVITGAGDVLDCIMVPKVRNAGDVAFVDRALLQLEQSLGFAVGRIGIEAQIEDAEGLMRADEIAFSSTRLETLTFGPADFSASMQLPSLTVRNNDTYPGDLFHYVLFKLAVAARAAGIQVIDGPYLAIHDVEGYRAVRGACRGARLRREMGAAPGADRAGERGVHARAGRFRQGRAASSRRTGGDRGGAQGCGDARRRDDRRSVAEDRRCSSTRAVLRPA